MNGWYFCNKATVPPADGGFQSRCRSISARRFRRGAVPSYIPEGTEIILSVVAVHAVIDGDEADIMLRKVVVGVFAHFQIVPPKP